jgi:hypothetical protein
VIPTTNPFFRKERIGSSMGMDGSALIFTTLNLLLSFVTLLIVLWYRNLSAWCWVLVASSFVTLCLSGMNLLQTLNRLLGPNALPGFNLFDVNLYYTISILNLLARLGTAVGLCGLLFDLKKQLEFLREASHNENDPFGDH